MLLSYKYRIKPNRTQGAHLAEMLADFCCLYNAGLEQRIDAWPRRHISVGYNMQCAELKGCAGTFLDIWKAAPKTDFYVSETVVPIKLLDCGRDEL